MWTCATCATGNEDDAEDCAACGAPPPTPGWRTPRPSRPLPTPAVAAPTPAPTPAPPAGPTEPAAPVTAPAPAPPPAVPPPATPAAAPPRRRGAGLAVALLAVALVVAVAVAAVLLTRSDGGPEALTATVRRTCGADGTSDCFLSVRSAPGEDSVERGRLDEGSTVEVVCQVQSDPARSSVLDRSSTVWARTVDGEFVAAIYLDVPGWDLYSVTRPC